MAAVKVARLFLCFSNRWQVGPPVALLFLLLAAGVECCPSAPEPCMRRSVPSQSCSRFVQVPIGGPAAEVVRPVVTGCDRAGPRAPARQMVVRITLCTCLEGREGTGNQPNPGFPRNPSLAPLPLLSTVCSIFFSKNFSKIFSKISSKIFQNFPKFFPPTHPPTHPRTRTLSFKSTYSAVAHRGRALPPLDFFIDIGIIIEIIVNSFFPLRLLCLSSWCSSSGIFSCGVWAIETFGRLVKNIIDTTKNIGSRGFLDPQE